MRPHVHVNVAMSADGKLSTRERRQVRISGPADFSRVDRIKAESDAVMVGIGTVLADDPSLTVKSPDLRALRIARGVSGDPVRIVVDSMARISPDASILHKGEGERIVACSELADPHRMAVLGKYATVLVAGHDRVDLTRLLNLLFQRGIRRVMVEGGGTLIAGLFSENLVDELTCFVGNMIIGGRDAPTLADGPGFTDEKTFVRLILSGMEQVDDGILISWRVAREE